MSNENPSPEALPAIRVLAADRTRMNSQLLVEALTKEQQLTIMEADSAGSAILAAVANQEPNVVLLSSELEENPGLGFQVARQLRGTYPNVRVVMLLDSSERRSVLDAFRAGARGVFSRTESLTALAKCIYCVHSGQIWANSRELGYLADAISHSPSLSLVPAQNSAKLSKREMDVVRCVVEGLSNREIARRLGLTEHTVKNYLLRIFDKLGVTNRVGVVLYAFSIGQPPNARSGQNPQIRQAHIRQDALRNTSEPPTEK